jgi:hypothetical protein
LIINAGGPAGRDRRYKSQTDPLPTSHELDTKRWQAYGFREEIGLKYEFAV